MHSNGFFLKDVAGFLGGYYTFIAVMNGVAALILWRRKGQVGWALAWTAFAGAMMVLASLALSGSAELVPALPQAARSLVNRLSGPVLYTLGTTALLTILFVFRSFFVKPMVAWAILNGMLLLMGLSMADENFAAIVMKPDNVPIVGLVFCWRSSPGWPPSRPWSTTTVSLVGCRRWRRKTTRRCWSGRISCTPS